MATPDPRPDYPETPPPADPRDPRYAPPADYRQAPVVVERGSSAGVWAFVIVLLLLVIAGVLYFTGVFNGRSLVSETDKVDIHVHAPASPNGGGGGSTAGGSTGGGAH